MATASATASNVLLLTTEKENYLRIARLLIVGGTELMRNVFDKFYPPSSLRTKLTNPATKKQLATLMKPQRDCVYPSAGVCGESKDFDISLLSRLLKTICPLPPVLTGWDHLPNSTDLSVTADIVRIKVYRNDISHKYHNMEISDGQFYSLWNEIKNALIRIADYINTATRGKWEKAIGGLLNDPLTPEAEKNARELYEWYLKDMDGKECTERGLKNVQTELKVSSDGIKQELKGKLQNVSKEMAQEMKKGVDCLKREIHDVRGFQETTDRRIDEGVGRLEKEIQDVQASVSQLREQIIRRAGPSSAELGALLSIVIEAVSFTGPHSQAPGMATPPVHVQPTLSGDTIPSGPAVQGSFLSEQHVMNIITLEMFHDLQPSTPEEINGFVQHIRDIRGALIVGINNGSLVLTVKCNSLEILEDLWEDYSTGLLGEMAQKFLVTDEILEELGLVEVKLKTTISEDEYQACQNYLMENSDSFPEEEGRTLFWSSSGTVESFNSGTTSELSPELSSAGRWLPRPDPPEYSAGNGTNLSHLPRSVQHFVNREKEIGDITKYLSPDDDCRCVLVLGAPGMGKTATAIKVANEISDTNPDDSVRVVYVNCRSTATLDDLAAKIGKQLHHLLSNEPISEIKRHLIIENDIYTVLLLDNFESIDPNENEKVHQFIIEIVAKSEKVKLLITSTENVVFPSKTCTERIRLLPFNEDDSFKLLKKVYGYTPLEKETAYKIARFCSGIPHVLRSLASWEDHPLPLLEMFTDANPKQQFEMITKIPAVTEEEKIHVCLDACFNRLNAQLQGTLVSLTLFRGLFTMSRAVEVFRSDDLKGSIIQLAQKSFLEKSILDPTAPCRYSLLPFNKIFCQIKAQEAGFHREFSAARKLFIEHYLAFLEDTFKIFLSIDVSRAINEFQQEDENILQLIDWFGENGGMDEDQERRCIDVFNDVGELLAKMLPKKKFDTVFTMLKKKCEDMEDQKRLSECLTSLGIKEIFSCTCSPGLCNQAAERAKTNLLEADRIQSALGINDGNSRAQCLSKLGRCLAKNGKFREGKDKIQQAIDIRKAHGDEDIVMLGATYNDLAVALSLEGDHREAINTREQQTLPIYRKQLGDHPFTATILNNLSNNFYALGEYDNAKQYSEEALKIRLELLKDHYDTAKSLFDLGMVHKKKKEFEEAKVNLEKCVDMQMKVLDVDCNDIKRTREELNELNNHLVE